MEIDLVQNLKENCPHDYIPFNMKGNGNIIFSVQEICVQRSLRYLCRAVRRIIIKKKLIYVFNMIYVSYL